MKLIISAETVKYPLTGIGRYTQELVRYAALERGIDELYCYARGKKISIDAFSSVSRESLMPRVRHKPVFDYAYQKVKQLPYIALLTEYLQSYVESLRLEGLDEYLYHGTNYRLPERSGPSIITIYDLSVLLHPEWHPKDRIMRMSRVIPQAIQRATHIITISSSVKREMIEHLGVDGSRITAIPLGVDEAYHPREDDELLDPLAELGLTPQGYSLFVSTVEPRKNIKRMIAAFSMLPEPVKLRWPLVIVGSQGWNSQSVHRVIAQGERAGWLRYLGYVPETVLPALYAGCRAFFYPSLYEGFGLPILEAMASGAPVVTSDCSSMPEVAGGAGLCVDPQDVDNMAESFLKALEDEPWRASAVAQGFQQIVGLNWQQCAKATFDVYRRVLSAVPAD